MDLTLQEVHDKEEELKKTEELLEEALLQQQEAKSFGDFSENAELESATARVRELQKTKNELLDQLSDYNIIKTDRGPRITIGSYVIVTKVDDKNKPIENSRTFRLASEGDTINKKTLSIDSPLGKAILNGTDGVYSIQTAGGVFHYEVKKDFSSGEKTN